jgi:hypothetical protein
LLALKNNDFTPSLNENISTTSTKKINVFDSAYQDGWLAKKSGISQSLSRR